MPKYRVLMIVVMFVAISTAPIAVNAQPVKAQDAAQQRLDEAKENLAEKKVALKTKLEDTKLKICQKREKIITNIMARISDRGTKQVAVFTKISDRTQAFYLQKGRTLSNYDALVADVVAKKAAAEAAVELTKSSSVSFECDGTDPKGTASVFKENMKAQNAALKAYKSAVNNLIVGVKSAQSTENSEGEH